MWLRALIPAFFKLDMETNLWTQLPDFPPAHITALPWYLTVMTVFISAGEITSRFLEILHIGQYLCNRSGNRAAGKSVFIRRRYDKGKDKDGYDVIYAIRGGSDDLYAYYLTDPGQHLVPKASAPYSAYYGSGLAYDSASGYVWYLAGNGTGFAKYSIANDVWDNTVTSPALPPHFLRVFEQQHVYERRLSLCLHVRKYTGNQRTQKYVWGTAGRGPLGECADRFGSLDVDRCGGI
jgi:hypothetical protein